MVLFGVSLLQQGSANTWWNLSFKQGNKKCLNNDSESESIQSKLFYFNDKDLSVRNCHSDSMPTSTAENEIKVNNTDAVEQNDNYIAETSPEISVNISEQHKLSLLLSE